MPDEPERRLQRALAGLPGPDAGAEDRALRAALAALPGPGRADRRARRAALAAGIVLAAAVAGGAALAVAGRLEVRLGADPAPPAPPAGQVDLPAQARGLAALGGGRLWAATRAGLAVPGLAASAAELSPRALYLAAGIGGALVVLSPDAGQAWTQPVDGRVVGIAWAPNPIRLAYVTRDAGGHRLRVVEGDGDEDRLADPDAGPARPSWRADTLAVAYAGADGRPRVLDLYRGLVLPVRGGCPGPVRAVAFAPSGGHLAWVTPGGLSVASPGGAPGVCVPARRGAAAAALAWLHPRDLLTAEVGGDGASGAVRRFGLDAQGRPRPIAGWDVAGAPTALAAAPDGAEVAVAVRLARRRAEVWVAAPPGSIAGSGAPARTVALRAEAAVSTLSWR